MRRAGMLSRLSFGAKINLGIALIVVFSGVVSAVFISRAASDALSQEIKTRGANLGRNLADRAVEPILTLNYLNMNTIVDQVKDLDDTLVYVFLLDHDNQVLAHSYEGGFPVELAAANLLPPDSPLSMRLLQTGDDLLLDFALPVATGGVRIGTARLGFSHRAQSHTVLKLLYLVAAITAATVALGLAAGSMFAGMVSRRLNTLRDFAEQLVSGRLDIRVAPKAALRCWEEFSCTMRDCPAHGDKRCRCWLISGTLCDRTHCSDQSCDTCPVYKASHGDELQSLAESFDAMAVALKGHIDDVHAKEELVNSQKRLLKTIFDANPDLMCLLNDKLAYRAVNKALCEHFGLAEEALLGQRYQGLFPAEPDEGASGAATDRAAEERAVLASMKPVSQEVRLTRNGAERWFHVLKVPVVRPAGKTEVATGLLVTARDITRLKSYQQQLVQSQKMESLGRLAGGVAHEINTPLAIILGYAQILLEDVLPDDPAAKRLGLIERHAQACRKIVADLLTFSRREEGGTEALDLASSLAEVVDIVTPIFKQEGVSLVFLPHPDGPRVNADRDRLKQVWMNLFTNAFDAMEGGGVIVVRVGLAHERGAAFVRVADTGSGIPPERLAQVFEPFYSTKPAGEGTGLGLSVSFGIVEEFHGAIYAESPAPPEDFAGVAPPQKPGPGTVFVVELPLWKPGNPSAPAEGPDAPKQG